MPPKSKSPAKRPAGAAKGKKPAKKVKRVDVDLSQYDFTTNAMDDVIDAIKDNVRSTCLANHNGPVFSRSHLFSLLVLLLKVSTECGMPILAGSVNWNVMSSKQKPDPSELLWEPHVLSFFKDIPIRDVAMGPCGSTITFVAQSGHVFTMGERWCDSQGTSPSWL